MNIETIPQDKIAILATDTPLNGKLLAGFIKDHRVLVQKRFEKLKKAYLGDYDILHQKPKEMHKPDNRVVVNFVKYIVDTMNGFFIGNPIKTTADDLDINTTIQFIDSYNDQDDNNAELSKMCSIFGKAYELYFVDESSNLGITYISPIESFMIYDDSVVQKPRYFVRYSKTSKGNIVGIVYDSQYEYQFDSKTGYNLGDGMIHNFQEVPASEYLENEERMGIAESVLSMVNAYNKAVSEKANDVDYFADAYLKIIGAELSEEERYKIKDNRIINLYGQGLEKIIVEFMDKPNSDNTQENLINRLERLIYQMSMVANINDENFGNASGIAMKYKLQSMINLAKTKERKFTSGMNRRYKVLFSHILAKRYPDDWLKVKYKFTYNLPTNLLEESQIAGALSGIVSKDTQLSIISVVDDVKAERKRIEEETVDLSYSTDYDVQRVIKDE